MYICREIDTDLVVWLKYLLIIVFKHKPICVNSLLSWELKEKNKGFNHRIIDHYPEGTLWKVKSRC